MPISNINGYFNQGQSFFLGYNSVHLGSNIYYW